jgi:hypothetical protein
LGVEPAAGKNFLHLTSPPPKKKSLKAYLHKTRFSC